jgi:hypothetical protein
MMAVLSSHPSPHQTTIFVQIFVTLADGSKSIHASLPFRHGHIAQNIVTTFTGMQFFISSKLTKMSANNRYATRDITDSLALTLIALMAELAMLTCNSITIPQNEIKSTSAL